MGSLVSLLSIFSLFPVGSSPHSRVTWPQKPAQVVVQKQGLLRDTEPEKISLRELIETRCPNVLTPFKAAWWLFKYALLCHPRPDLTRRTCSGHLQTTYTTVGDFSKADPVVYDRCVTRATLLWTE
jgi:hypothetical protein